MEFIPLEGKKKKSDSLKTLKGAVSPKKKDKLKNQSKTLNTVLQIKKVKNLNEEKNSVKKPKNSVNIESKKEVLKHRKKSLKLNNYIQKKNNKESKLLKNKCNSENSTEEEKKEQLKLEKWKRLDEKKKNRLFVLRKKKIKNESEIKQLHPDIKAVIFPRKKNSRWCWAVFASEEKANEAFKNLVDNKECFVSKPNSCAKVDMKRKKKMITVKRKLDAKKKLQTLWT